MGGKHRRNGRGNSIYVAIPGAVSKGDIHGSSLTCSEGANINSLLPDSVWRDIVVRSFVYGGVKFCPTVRGLLFVFMDTVVVVRCCRVR